MMGAFVIFPVLLFSVFISAVLGFGDYLHVATLVHAAAENAASAGAADIAAQAAQGAYQVGGGSLLAGDANAVDGIAGQMLAGKPYITSSSCTTVPAGVDCTVTFAVTMPILGSVTGTTTAFAGTRAL